MGVGFCCVGFCSLVAVFGRGSFNRFGVMYFMGFRRSVGVSFASYRGVVSLLGVF